MKILVGDILKSNVQTLINTVNCVGIMGKGIALEFKNRFPDMFKDYVQRCQHGEVRLGEPYLYKPMFGPQIINFPTKDHWKSISKVQDIERGLNYLVSHYKQWGITSIAIPPLGCGNGQLEWKVVGPLIYKMSKQMDISVEIYAPYGTNPAELTVEFLEIAGSAITGSQVSKGIRISFNPIWLGLVEIVKRIQQQPYHWPVGRVIFQKIAYVATRVGLPTGFNYRRGSYGPFSRELKFAETQLINSNLMQEERLGRMFAVKVGPSFEETKLRYESLLNKYSDVIEKTTDLFMRVDTKQAEVLATVIYAAVELKGNSTKNFKVSEIDVFDAVKKWKPLINNADVASTIRNLGMLGWLDVKPDEKLPIPEQDAACMKKSACHNLAQKEIINSIGNRQILNNSKLALFCSIKCPGNLILRTYDLAKSLRDKGVTVISGFHSPMEQEVLNILLKGTQPIIISPARGIENMRIPAAWKPALEKNRLLLLSSFAKGKDRMTEANALRRNKYVAEIADAVFVAYAAPGGKTESFCRDLLRNNKPLFTFDTIDNQNLITVGAKLFSFDNWQIK